MEFSISTESLKKEVSLLQSVTDKKSGIGALSNILVETTDTGIKLTASDLDTTIKVELPAQIKTSGHMCVSGKKLCDVVKSLDDGQINFKKDKNEWVQVKCNSSKFRMAGLAKEHFPVIPEIENDEVTIDGDTIKSLISHTCFAVTNEESRFALGGAKIEIENGKISMAATDGHRIAMMTEDIDDIEAKLDVLVPKRALSEITKFVGNEVVITQDPNHIKFESGDRILISRKLAPNFPDYRKAIPKDNTIEVEFDAGIMVKALRRNAIMADETSHSVQITIEAEKMTLKSAANGESEEVVKCTTKDLPEEGLTFHINWVYLVEYLSICADPVLKLKDALSAVEVIDGTSICIIMPLRVSGI